MGQFIVNEIDIIAHSSSSSLSYWQVLRSGQSAYRTNTQTNDPQFLQTSGIISNVSTPSSGTVYVTVKKSGYYSVTDVDVAPQPIQYYEEGAVIVSIRAAGDPSYIIYFGDSNPFE